MKLSSKGKRYLLIGALVLVYVVVFSAILISKTVKSDSGNKLSASTGIVVNGNGGNISGNSQLSLSKNADGTITKPQDPTRAGFTFKGWYKDEACTEEFDFNTPVEEEDLTIYAKWEEDPLAGTTEKEVFHYTVMYSNNVPSYVIITGLTGCYPTMIIPPYIEVTMNGKTYQPSVTEIGDGVFQNQTILNSVTLPSTLKTVGNYAFYNCKNLSTVNFNGGNNLETIGVAAFSDTNIKTFTISKSVRYIANFAFGQIVTSLETVVVESVSPLICGEGMGGQIFGIFSLIGKKNNFQIIVPKYQGSTYRNLAGWSLYKDYIVDPMFPQA